MTLLDRVRAGFLSPSFKTWAKLFAVDNKTHSMQPYIVTPVERRPSLGRTSIVASSETSGSMRHAALTSLTDYRYRLD